MKKALFFIFVFCISYGYTQNPEFLGDMNCTFHQNEKYGDGEKNVFDIVLPKSDELTPLIIYIHGGGFVEGDKKEAYWRKEDIKYFIQHKVAFATINYRFYNPYDSLGVKLCLNDVKTAIQYIRFHAKEYNIDKSRIGCYGKSAGAGSSLYFGFHDELALKEDTTLLGESTRVKCIGAIDTQATYNVERWFSFIPCLRLFTNLKQKEFRNALAHFYGCSTYNEYKHKKRQLLSNLDMLEMIDKDDPPVYILNLQKQRLPKDFGLIYHHRRHAIELSKILKKHHVRHKMYVYSKKVKKEKEINYQMKEFMVEQLRI